MIRKREMMSSRKRVVFRLKNEESYEVLETLAKAAGHRSIGSWVRSLAAKAAAEAGVEIEITPKWGGNRRSSKN